MSINLPRGHRVVRLRYTCWRLPGRSAASCKPTTVTCRSPSAHCNDLRDLEAALVSSYQLQSSQHRVVCNCSKPPVLILAPVEDHPVSEAVWSAGSLSNCNAEAAWYGHHPEASCAPQARPVCECAGGRSATVFAPGALPKSQPFPLHTLRRANAHLTAMGLASINVWDEQKGLRQTFQCELEVLLSSMRWDFHRIHARF